MKAFVTEMLAEYNKCDKSNVLRLEWLLHKAMQLRQLCDDFAVYKNKDYEYLDMLIMRISIDIEHWKRSVDDHVHSVVDEFFSKKYNKLEN